MAQPTHVFVTAAEGRKVPIPSNEASAPGAALLLCEPGKVYRLPYTTHTRRRITSGDLVLTDQGGTAVDSIELADSAEPLAIDATGAIAVEEFNAEGSTKPLARATASVPGAYEYKPPTRKE